MNVISVSQIINRYNYSIGFDREDVGTSELEARWENIFIIYALNGMGKTNFLKLIYFFSNFSAENLVKLLRIPFTRYSVKYSDHLYAAIDKDVKKDEFTLRVIEVIDSRPIVRLEVTESIKGFSAEDYAENDKLSKVEEILMGQEHRVTFLATDRTLYTGKSLRQILGDLENLVNEKINQILSEKIVKQSEGLLGISHQDLLDRYKSLEELISDNSVIIREVDVVRSASSALATIEDPSREVLEYFANNLYLYSQIADLQSKINLFLDCVNRNLLHNNIDYADGRFILESGKLKIPPSDLSSGENNLLYIFSTLLKEIILQGDLVIIDEPEISLGLEWREKFLTNISKFIEGSGVKILLASHSMEVLGEFPTDFLETAGGEE
ncbi:AAA family ATPase [Rothia sp. CCM 9416]|uniref:AAA family ATPase n=1 Tax=Rothia sp. CCM 9416 TaxID=3402655 RepID=UPI003AEE4292